MTYVLTQPPVNTNTLANNTTYSLYWAPAVLLGMCEDRLSRSAAALVRRRCPWVALERAACAPLPQCCTESAATCLTPRVSGPALKVMKLNHGRDSGATNCHLIHVIVLSLPASAARSGGGLLPWV